MSVRTPAAASLPLRATRQVPSNTYLSSSESTAAPCWVFFNKSTLVANFLGAQSVDLACRLFQDCHLKISVWTPLLTRSAEMFGAGSSSICPVPTRVLSLVAPSMRLVELSCGDSSDRRFRLTFADAVQGLQYRMSKACSWWKTPVLGPLYCVGENQMHAEFASSSPPPSAQCQRGF